MFVGLHGSGVMLWKASVSVLLVNSFLVMSFYCHLLYAFLRNKLKRTVCKLEDLTSALKDPPFLMAHQWSSCLPEWQRFHHVPSESWASKEELGGGEGGPTEESEWDIVFPWESSNSIVRLPATLEPLRNFIIECRVYNRGRRNVHNWEMKGGSRKKCRIFQTNKHS